MLHTMVTVLMSLYQVLVGDKKSMKNQRICVNDQLCLYVISSISEWLQRTGNQRLQHLNDTQLRERRVCSIHFQPEDYVGGSRPTLKPGSKPKSSRQGVLSPIYDTVIDDSSQNCLANKENFCNNPNSNECTSGRQSQKASVSRVTLENSLNKAKSIIQKQRRELNVLRQKNKRLKRASEAPYKFTASRLIAGASQVIKDKKRLFVVKMQIEHLKKKAWSPQEKKNALDIYQHSSRRCYKHLRNDKHVALPCLTLIDEWVNELQISPGFNQEFFIKLKNKVELMDEHKRDCVIMWDEMTIKKWLEYDSKNDIVHGFMDFGRLGRSNLTATHALVFMARGLNASWKQPLAYFLPHGTTTSSTLTELVKDCLHNVFSVGLKVRFMVCDQASTNSTMIIKSHFHITNDRLFYEFEGFEIYFGFDIPHLLKCLRNAWLQADLIWRGQLVSWGTLKELRELENNKVCKSAFKLTGRHLAPDKFERMNVKLAVQVFSHGVSAALKTGHATGELKHPTCIATAEFIDEVNKLFDCLNARSVNNPNPYRAGLSDSRPFVENVLTESCEWLKNLKIADGSRAPPNFSNFSMTIRSILALWAKLREENVPYLLTAHLQQDPLENMFGQWRESLGCNRNPTAKQVKSKAQHSMLININKPPEGANCIDDGADLLLATTQTSSPQGTANETQNIQKPTVICTTVNSSEDSHDATITIPDFSYEEIMALTEDISLEESSIRYVAGYVAHRCFEKFSCFDCLTSLVKENQNLETPNETLIYWKAYRTVEADQLGNLKAPSEEFNCIISAGFKIFETLIKPTLHKIAPRERFITRFRKWLTLNYPSWLNDVHNTKCANHRNFTLDVFSRTLIYYNLKWLTWTIRDEERKRGLKEQDGKEHHKLKKLKHK